MQELKVAGLKITTPRVTILELIQKKANKNHFSAEEIFKLLRDNNSEVGLATVYRVLSQFEQAGILVKHNFEGGQSIFELNTGEHHDHLICIKCNEIIEFLDNRLERIQEEVAEKNNFILKDHSMILYGVCSKCQ